MNLVLYKYNPHSQFGSIEEIWTTLLKKCPHTYFLSWPWTETWLKSLPTNCGVSFIAGFLDESPVIAFFLGHKTATRGRFFKFRQIALNQTLDPNIDIIWIEYNKILIDPEFAINIEDIIKLLPIEPWDEFHLTRCESTLQPPSISHFNDNHQYNVFVVRHKSLYVNLKKIRENNDDYLTLISRNKRNQIRRSIKEYSKIGELKLTIAENVKEALIILDELIELHQKRWTARGEPGAFSNPYFINFHKNIITERLNYGEIQLLKLTAGQTTIGCLYSFIYNGNVLFYQSGFNYTDSNLFRPGLTCHYHAIIHNAILGHNNYDFLSDDDQYKISLATDYNEMLNIVIQKQNLKYMMWRLARRIYRTLKKANSLISSEREN